jgi:hypothetical protein
MQASAVENETRKKVCTKEELEEKLKRIQHEIDELKLKINRARLDINEYCSELINQVDIVVETRIEDLNERRKELLQEIRDYEQECVRKMEANKAKLVERAEKMKDWATRVQESRTSDNFMCELNKQAEIYLAELKNLFTHMKAFQLSGQQMEFQEEDMCDLGSLKIKEMKKQQLILESIYYFTAYFNYFSLQILFLQIPNTVLIFR